MPRKKQANPKRSVGHQGEPWFGNRTFILQEPAFGIKRRKLNSGTQKKLLGSLLKPTMGDTDMASDTPGKGSGTDAVYRNYMPGLGPQVYGFPKAIITKLRYNQTVTLTSTSGAVQYNVWRANSIFDPDQSGTGHQPMFHDNYANIYNNYRVLSSKITAVFTPLQDLGTSASDITSRTGPWHVGINGTNSTASYSATPETRIEANDSRSALLNARTGSDGVIVIEEEFTPESTLGRPVSDDVNSSTVGGNPSQQWYWQTWCSDYSGSTSSVVCKVMITYTVEFFNLINQAQH